MSIPIQLKRGTRAQVNALAASGGLLVGEPLFITDEKELAVASSVTNYSGRSFVNSRFIATTANDAAINADIIFSNIVTNTGDYSTANGRFTAPISGMYCFTCTVLLDITVAAGRVDFKLFVNGASISTGGIIMYKTASQYESISFTEYVLLNAGDYATARVAAAPTAAPLYTNDNGWNKFSGFLVN